MRKLVLLMMIVITSVAGQAQFATYNDLINFINTRIVPNGNRAITGADANTAFKGGFQFFRDNYFDKGTSDLRFAFKNHTHPFTQIPGLTDSISALRIAINSSGSTYTQENGLSLIDNKFGLGGNLIRSTTIGGAFPLTITTQNLVSNNTYAKLGRTNSYVEFDATNDVTLQGVTKINLTAPTTFVSGDVRLSTGRYIKLGENTNEAGLPSENGLLTYNPNTGKLRGREGGVWKDLISLGGGLPNGGVSNQALVKIDAANQNTQWSTIDKAFIGLPNVQNLDQTIANNLLSGTIPAGRYGATSIPLTALNAPGTPSSTTFLSGAGWTTVSGSGLGTVTQVTGVNTTGITWSIANNTTTPAITLALTKAAVDLANVPNVDATNATNITSGTLPDARLSANVVRSDLNYSNPTWINSLAFSKITVGGTPNGTKFLADNGTWMNPPTAPAPPGADEQVIFNQAGAFGADPVLKYEYSGQRLITPRILALGNISIQADNQGFTVTNGTVPDGTDYQFAFPYLITSNGYRPTNNLSTHRVLMKFASKNNQYGSTNGAPLFGNTYMGYNPVNGATQLSNLSQNATRGGFEFWASRGNRVNIDPTLSLYATIDSAGIIIPGLAAAGPNEYTGITSTGRLVKMPTPSGGSGGLPPDGDYGDVIFGNTFTTATVDNLAINSAKLADNAVTTPKIANGQVTDAKIQSLAWTKITGTPTTIAGYNIGDAVSLSGNQTLINKTLDGANNTFSNIGVSSLIGVPANEVTYGGPAGGLASNNKLTYVPSTGVLKSDSINTTRVGAQGINTYGFSSFFSPNDFGNITSQDVLTVQSDGTPMGNDMSNTNGGLRRIMTISPNTFLGSASAPPLYFGYTIGDKTSAIIPGGRGGLDIWGLQQPLSTGGTIRRRFLHIDSANFNILALSSQTGGDVYIGTDQNGNVKRMPTPSGGGSVTVPGSDQQVIFNDGGSFGAHTGMTYNKSTGRLTSSLLTSGLATLSGVNSDMTVTVNMPAIPGFGDLPYGFPFKSTGFGNPGPEDATHGISTRMTLFHQKSNSGNDANVTSGFGYTQDLNGSFNINRIGTALSTGGRLGFIFMGRTGTFQTPVNQYFSLIDSAGMKLWGLRAPSADEYVGIGSDGRLKRMPTPSGGSGTTYTGTPPIFVSGSTIGIADAQANGINKGAAAFNANDFNSTSGLISLDYDNMSAASTSSRGILTPADWNTFNNKMSDINLTTNNTSGPATWNSSTKTLNIPNYATGSGGGGGLQSFNGRTTAAAMPASGDYTWAMINKSTSSFADITTRSASDINQGTLANARLSPQVVLNPMTQAGAIIQGGTGGTPTNLAPGSPFQQLRMNSSGNALEYFTPSAPIVPTLEANTYTPSYGISTGVAQFGTPFQWQYSRIGNVVTVSGQLYVTVSSANSAHSISVTLPVPTTMDFNYRLAGSGNAAGTGNNYYPVHVDGRATDNRAMLRFRLPASEAAGNIISISCTFTYLVIDTSA